ncbi:MAG: ATP-binding cassette domain-containing protein, partial [Candidatus Cloacimonadota bacterium]|nr:ATP-binding cassette domain-containing protein [Candidatus Cloacimonadota bacterium]
MKDYSLSVNPSEIIFLKGDSGSGKTTFLNIIATIIPRFIHGELQGKVLYQKTDLQKIDFPEIAKYIGFLRQHPQQQLFFPNVEQELAFGPENLCIPPKEILNKIDAVCSDLGIADYRFAA